MLHDTHFWLRTHDNIVTINQQSIKISIGFVKVFVFFLTFFCVDFWVTSIKLSSFTDMKFVRGKSSHETFYFDDLYSPIN